MTGWGNIAFPSFSSHNYCSDVSKAVVVATAAISEFLSEHKDENLCLVLTESDPKVRTLFKKHYVLDDPRLIIRDFKITAMKTAGIPCCFLVNVTTWRLKSGEVATAAGTSFLDSTKSLYKTGECGKAYPVVLGDESSLYTDERVRVIVHVIPPNIDNTTKPDCLNHNYEKGIPLLKLAYVNLLRSFYQIYQAVLKQSKSHPE